MNFFLHLSLFDSFRILLLIIYLFFILLIVLYNWLYISRTLQANKQIGVKPPEHIENLVKASTGVALVTAAFIGILLITGLY